MGGWVILAIGVFAILAALAYTAGPFPLAYHGLGDLFAFLFFGIIAVTGTYYIQAQHFTWLVAGRLAANGAAGDEHHHREQLARY